MRFWNLRRKHSFSYNIFSGNLKELNGGLKLIENPQIGLQLSSEKNREAGDQAHREVNRLFHNFLAAAATLIDHTRIFVNQNYEDTPIQQAYNKKIKSEYEKDELCNFIKHLRNYIVHQGLPDNKWSFGLKKGHTTFESTISLETEKLVVWSGWKPLSKSYLSKQGKSIKLSSLIAVYSEKIIGLYKWLDTKLIEYHANDLKKLEKLQAEFQNLEK
jgi:hypothetical protein